MRVIALDADKALHDMVKVFHYGYIDEVSVFKIKDILNSSIHDDLGYYLNIEEEFIGRLMLQVIKESLINYVDAVLKALVHQQTYTIFDALHTNYGLSESINLKVNDSPTLIPMFNSVRPDLAFYLDIDYVMLRSIAVVLDRVKLQNNKLLELKTMELICALTPQLISEHINHVIRTELLTVRTVAMLVN